MPHHTHSPYCIPHNIYSTYTKYVLHLAQERLQDGRKNWYPCQEATIPYFCQVHSAERAEHERNKEITRLADLTQGKEDREPYQDKEPYTVPADIGLAFRKFSSVLAAPGTANGQGHGSGGGGARGGVAFNVASVAQQWGQLFPELPLPRGLLTTTPKTTDFTYVADTVDRWERWSGRRKGWTIEMGGDAVWSSCGGLISR